MKPLSELLSKGKKLRVLGVDDAPFQRERGSIVDVCGVVCSANSFEGMIWTSIEKDGTNVTQTLAETILKSKFYQQLHVVLTNGITFGGFNVLDLRLLAERINRPCIAVVRKQPDFEAFEKALHNFTDVEFRFSCYEAAGPLFSNGNVYFHAIDCTEHEARAVIDSVAINGHIPEPLRIAHLIAAAVKTGESSNRA